MSTLEEQVSGRPTRDRKVREALLVALTFSSGAVDAVTFLCLGKVFSAFMTGNLVFIGLRLGGAPGPAWHRVLASLVAFAVGAMLSGRLVRSTERDGEVWPGGVTLAMSVALVAQALFVGVWRTVDAQPSSAASDLLIVFSALAMGIQTAAISVLGVRGVFTTAATATLAMLMGDLSGWSQSKGERLRLLGVITGLVAGALIGGFLVVHARYWAPVLPLGVTFAVVSATLLFPRRRAGWRRSTGQPGAQRKSPVPQ